MALHTLGTAATTSLVALQYYDSVAQTDLGTLETTLAGDRWTAAPGTSSAPQEPGAQGPQGIIATGTTSSSSNPTNITSMTFVTGGALSTIKPGMTVLGAGIPSGSNVVSFSGTTLVISQSCTASATGVYVLIIPYNDPEAFVSRDKLLHIPRRGILKVRPGDVIARDNTGWPILLSGASLNYGGSQWTYT